MGLRMTHDQGREMAVHRKLSDQTGMAEHFCDPRSSWQRCSNENTSGFVREYLPKEAYLSNYGQEQFDAIADEINNRPRKGSGYDHRWRTTVSYVSTTSSIQHSFIK